MTVLRTYEDVLKERGRVTTDKFNCPECDREEPPFAIVEAAPDRWVCSTCYINEQRGVQEQARTEQIASMEPWETEEANHVRALRIQMQERWRWAVMPDSPLTSEAQARVMKFLKTLNTLTIDYTTPQDVVWPDEPIIGSGDYDATNA